MHLVCRKSSSRFPGTVRVPLAGAPAAAAARGPLLLRSLFPSSVPLRPLGTAESQAQAHPVVALSPLSRGPQMPCPKPRKKGVWSPAQGELSLAPVLTPARLCPGLSGSSDPVLREASSSLGVKLPECLEGERLRTSTHPFATCKQPAGAGKFSHMFGERPMFLSKLSACWRKGDCEDWKLQG